MVRTKKSLLFALVMVLVIVMGISLAACDDGNDPTTTTAEYTVKFMVKENGVGEWKDYAQPVKSVNGKVTLPTEPSIEGFSFRGWFTDKKCETAFDENKVTADITVYAHMSDKVLTVKVNKGQSIDTKPEQNVADLTTLQESYALDANDNELTFDGWYSNEACTVKYNAESGTTEVYGRYVALVDFIDGYSEIEYTQKVAPGTKMEAIDESQVKMSYMDSIYGYAVVDDNGKPIYREGNGAAKKFDFNTNIDKNTTFSILWASQGLKYEQVGSSLVMVGIGQDKKYESLLKNTKVIRIPAFAQLDEKGDFIPVESVSLSQALHESAPIVEKIIFADGIKTISGFNAAPSLIGFENNVKEIVLPDTLKIIDTAFWNLNKLKEVNLPKGLEIIIDSFWGNCMGQFISHNTFAGAGVTSFAIPVDIVIPSSVKYLSMVPENFKFAEDSPFFYEGDSLYKKGVDNKYETLVYTKNVGTKFEIKEGVKFVQVGAFQRCGDAANKVDIIFPSTFEGVSYNPKAVDYPYYVGGVLDGGTNSGSPSFGEYRLYNDKTTEKGKAIVLGLDQLNRVVFNTPKIPSNLEEDAIRGANKNYTHKDFVSKDKVVSVGKITDGQPVKVTVRAYYKSKLVNSVEISDVLSNDTLVTKNMIATALGLNESVDYVITSIQQFDKDYFADESAAISGVKVTNNQYINVTYVDNAAGAKLEDKNGIMTVVGFEEQTAKYDDQKGGYVVSIPEVFNGKPVEAIANNAFKNNGQIVIVNIPANIKTIGDNAFMKCNKLSEINFGENSKLSVIGAHAFEDTIITKIAVPLKNLTEIKPYAFRIKTLEQFINVKGEEEYILTPDTQGTTDYSPIIGKYVLMENGGSNQFHTIYKLNAVNVVGKTPENDKYFPNKNISEYDVDLVAIAGGMKYGQYVIGINLFDIVMFKTNILEGSVYYLDGMCKDSKGSYGLILTKEINKVSENAFTRMSDNLFIMKDSEGQPTKKSNLKIAVGYGYNHSEAPALTMETMKEFFKGKAFQNEDGTLVKWIDGKEFNDVEIEKLNPIAISYSGMNLS